MRKVWWEKGSPVSPEIALATIESAEKEVASLKEKGYDVTEAVKKLDEAKEAYNAGDYATATSLAKEAPKLAIAPPPYALYAGVIVAIAVIAGVAVYWYRKRKT